MAVDLNLISIVAFYAIIFLYFYIKRKNIVRQMGVIFLYKTQKFTGIMRSVANWNPKFWRWFGYISIPIGFIGMALIFGYLGFALWKILITPATAPALSLVIPGVRIPGAVYVPFWYGIIALFTVITVHEGAHGIVSEAWKLKLQSAGVGMFAVLPLAFVEPPEDKLAKAKTRTQLGIFSAGVTANIIFALLVIGLTVGIGYAAPAHDGVLVTGSTPGLPSDEAGMKAGEVIISANGMPVKTINDFTAVMQKVKVGESIAVKTVANDYSIKTIANQRDKNKAYIGIQFRQNVPAWEWHIINLLYWIFTLNIGIGIINLLPLGPIDGGRMLSAALRKFIDEKRATKIFGAVSMVSLFLLLANIIAPYLMKASMSLFQ
ncbi:MAG: site-2 protease family protein [DPANN group archaeon]|nr:site-2 protease family protein [DPANN group archaeon]